MGGIYRCVQTGATLIVLTGAALGFDGSDAHSTALWTQPSGVASGDRFLALGYSRGVELWDWNPSTVPVRGARLDGPRVTALWGSDSTLFWCAADSSLRRVVTQGSLPGAPDVFPLAGVGSEISGSEEFVAAVIGTSHVQFASRREEPFALADWHPPGGRPIAYVALRDSTAAIAGADLAFLVRLRDTHAELLDSLALGDFVQALAWAGDSLFLAFGFSGMRLATTQDDAFTGSLHFWSGQGSFGRLALTGSACTAVDVFGDLAIFARGKPLVPALRVSYGGTPRSALGRRHELLLVTVERGLALLNLFTLSTPFWAHQSPLPGFVRDLETEGGLFALSDFSGVYRLGSTEELVVSHPYNAISLDVEGPHLAAVTLLGGVAVADLRSNSSEPYAVLPTRGFGRHAAIAGDRLFVAGDELCDTGLVVYRLSPPQPPAVESRLSVCGTLLAMEAGPGVIAFALRDSGIQLLDALAPEQGPVARMPGEPFEELAWDGPHLWGRNRSSELVQWLWNGTSLVESARFGVARLRAFAVSQGTLATADSGRFVRAWQSAPGSLVLIDSVATRNVASKVALLADTVWAVDGDAILRYELPVGAAVGEPHVRPESSFLGVPFPNPFNGEVSFTLTPPRGPWKVKAVDLLGRTQNTWSGVSPTSRPIRLTWKPRGGASGVYFIVAEHAAARESRKVLYLK